MTKNEAIKNKQWRYLTGYLRENNITYRQYLQSEHWKDVRRRYWKSKFPKLCHVCENSETVLELHHKTYKRIGKERLGDLCLLCRNCHERVHKIEKERPNGILWGATKRARKDFRKETQNGRSV